MKRNLSPTLIVVAILAALCGLSLYLRIHLGSSSVFVGDAVWFRETDAYFYLRYIENMVRNFPHYSFFDPCTLYPGGGGLGRPFFTWLAAGAALIVGGGNPTSHTIATVSAYLPPVLGTLTIIPVYFIGKELFNRWAGIIASALVVILPSEFLHRSLVGFTDHHVAEVLFTTTAVLFFIMAVKRSREREITFHHILTRDWAVIRKPFIYALLAGLFLGIYLLTWGGGLMFAFIMFAYLAVQFIVDHFRRRSADYLCIVSVPLFLIALLVYIPGVYGRIDTFTLLAFTTATAAPIAMSVVSRFLYSRNWKPYLYPVALLLILALGLGVVRLANPALFQSLSSSFSFMSPSSAMRTVMEAVPILYPRGAFTLDVVWGNFTTSFFIALISFGVLIYVTVRERSAPKTMFLIWSLVILIATLGQRRFGYYYTVNIALFTGYLSWKALDLVGLRKLTSVPKQVTGVVKAFRKHKKGKRNVNRVSPVRPRAVWVQVIIVGIVIFFLVFFPNIRPAVSLASSQSIVYSGMAMGWYESCVWLRDNTSDPFGNPDFYYQLYPSSRDEFKYPDGFYGVLSWWDYGYFIAQIGRRVPNANPSQGGADEAALFFTAQNETSANELADQRMSKYIMIDSDMVTGKFYAMVEWASGNMSEFYEACYVPSQEREGWLDPVILYYPAYYRSVAVRLYTFNGQAVTPTESLVVLYEDRVNSDGMRYRLITGAWPFSTYEEAEAYLSEQGPGNYRIASSNPFSSPVPLEAMVDYELVYSSSSEVSVAGQTMPGVKIFEYLGLPCAYGNWSVATSLPTVRFSVTCSELPVYEGNIYIIGGWDATVPVNTNTIYSISGDSYSSGAPYPYTGIANPAQVLYNGKIYVFGGAYGAYINYLRIYDIASNTWSSGTNVPWSAEGMLAAADPTTGIIYVGGGCQLPAALHDEWYAYNTATDTWTSKATMPNTRGNGATFYYDGGIYTTAGGGITGTTLLTTTWRYNIATDTWTTNLAELPTAVNLPANCFDSANGILYLFGGKTSPTSHVYTNVVQAYDVDNDVWLNLEENHLYLSVPASYGFTQGTLVGTTFYMFGGWDGIAEFDTLYMDDVGHAVPVAW